MDVVLVAKNSDKSRVYLATDLETLTSGTLHVSEYCDANVRCILVTGLPAGCSREGDNLS